jgi:hypothetical protein
MKTLRPRFESLEERNLLNAADTVKGLYAFLLDRAPEPGGLAGWTSTLNHGVPLTVVASYIANSPEGISDKVQHLYSDILGRAPDQGGYNHWVRFFESGGSTQEAEADFLASPEFFHKDAGGTNAGWLNAVYNIALSRDIDSHGEAAWSSLISAGVPFYSIAYAITNSWEANVNVVKGDYLEYTGTLPSTTALIQSATQLHNGGDDIATGVAVAILVSQQANQGALSGLQPFAYTPSTPGIYLQSHIVGTTGELHTFIRVVESDGTSFTIAGANGAPLAGGIYGTLVSATNNPYDGPTPSDPNRAYPVVLQAQVDIGNASVDAVANQLLAIANGYNNSATYFADPPLFGYNSNSYAAGVLQAAGLQSPSSLYAWGVPNLAIPLSDLLAPGINKPLPNSYFGPTSPPPTVPPPVTVPTDPDNDGDDDSGLTGY